MTNIFTLVVLIPFILFSCNGVYASDTQSTLLNKGDVAPYQGMLLTPDAANKVRIDVLELDYQKTATTNLTSEVSDYQQRLKNYQDENNNLSDRLAKSDTGFFAKAGFFILGAAITGVLAYGIYRSK